MASKQVVLWDLSKVPDTRVETGEILGYIFPAPMGVSAGRQGASLTDHPIGDFKTFPPHSIDQTRSGSEDKTATGGTCVDDPPDRSPEVLRLPLEEEILRVQISPEADSVSVLGLEMPQIHAGCRLKTLDPVDTAPHKVIHNRVQVAIGMKKDGDLQGGYFLYLSRQ